MVKRSGALLLAMLYVITVFGFALNLHYCANILVDVKINSPVKNCKTLSGKQMKSCKYEQINIKVKDAHQAEASSVIAGLFAVALPAMGFGDYTLPTPQSVSQNLCERGPPPTPPAKVSVFIKNCAFRI